MHNTRTIIVFLVKAASKNGDKEENLEVTGGVTTYCLERRLYKVLSNIAYSPSHHQAGGPMINNQSTLRTAPDWCKNVSLQYYLVIHIQSLGNQIVCVCVCVYMCVHTHIYIYVYAHILHNIERDAGRAKETKRNWTAVNTTCHFWHACHRFISPALSQQNAQTCPVDIYVI